MKKKFYALLIFTSITLYSYGGNMHQELDNDCFDVAVQAVIDAEKKSGIMMTDEQAFNYMNVAYAMCENFYLFN